MSTALHITTGDALDAILTDGLHPSEFTREGEPRVQMFTTKADLRHALDGWLGDLFDDPETELAVVAVNTTDLDVTCCERGWTVSCRCSIPASRIRLVERGL